MRWTCSPLSLSIKVGRIWLANGISGQIIPSSIHPSIYPSIHPSFYQLSIYPPIHLPMHLSIQVIHSNELDTEERKKNTIVSAFIPSYTSLYFAYGARNEGKSKLHGNTNILQKVLCPFYSPL